jgi:hypothetical protein
MKGIAMNMDAMSDGIAADAEALVTAAADLDNRLAAWQSRKDDHTLDAITGPLGTLVRNYSTAPDASMKALLAARDVLGESEADRLMNDIHAAFRKLSVSLDTVDITEPTAAAQRIADLLKVSYLKAALGDDLWESIETAYNIWQISATAYLEALKAATPVVQYRTGRGGRGGSRGGTGTRGRGQWLEDHGWYFVANCHSCGADVTSRSNPGSFQNDMAKHWPSCRGPAGGPIKLPDGSTLDRVMWRDENPEWADAHDGFSRAMYAVRDGAQQADGGGFTISRAVESAAA